MFNALTSLTLSLLVAASFFVLHGCSVDAPDPTNVAPTPQGPLEWTWDGPVAVGNTLFDVWSGSATDTWAVGALGTVIHHDGVEWRKMNAVTDQNLRGVYWTTLEAGRVAVGDAIQVVSRATAD